MSPILVLEDEYFIAADGVAEVQKRGFRAIAVGNLADALELAQTEQLDGALVDLNLCGEMAFPVIELLRRQMIPVVFYTGYPQIVLPQELSSVPLFQKPSQLAQAVDKLTLLMKSGAMQPDAAADFTGLGHQARVLFRMRKGSAEQSGRSRVQNARLTTARGSIFSSGRRLSGSAGESFFRSGAVIVWSRDPVY
jgi:DNA-binding response OmpR family regulator